MTKIPFTLEAWLKDKRQKVETRDGRPVKIISFKMTDTDNCPVAAQFRLCAGTPVVYLFDKDGHYKGEGTSNYDLFIVTPEEEMSEFENRLCEILYFAINDKIHSTDEEIIKNAKELAPELLSLAREQFIKDGYVIEKKEFHDAVEKIEDKHKAKMSIEYSSHCKVENGTRRAIMNWDEFQKVAQKFIDIGKAEALKDLPRWKLFRNGACGGGERPIALVKNPVGYNLTSCLGVGNEKYIMLSDLEKLPGFKEDGNETILRNEPH